jgi:hypothetical protein
VAQRRSNQPRRVQQARCASLHAPSALTSTPNTA